MNADQRRAATAQHQLAIEAINELFDKAQDLAAARDRLTGIKPRGPGDDPIRDAEKLLTYADLLSDALVQLRSAAIVAAEHRSRTDLCAGTKPTVLFPRPARHPGDPLLTLDPRPVQTPSSSTRKVAEMSSDRAAVIDLSLTDPTAIMHAVADELAGHCVDLAWATLNGVWSGPAVVLGCTLVDGVGFLLAVGLPTDDDETIEVSVAWHEILSVGSDLGDPPPYQLLKRIVTVSRWFGHQLEITQRDRARIVGTSPASTSTCAAMTSTSSSFRPPHPSRRSTASTPSPSTTSTPSSPGKPDRAARRTDPQRAVHESMTRTVDRCPDRSSRPGRDDQPAPATARWHGAGPQGQGRDGMISTRLRRQRSGHSSSWIGRRSSSAICASSPRRAARRRL